MKTKWQIGDTSRKYESGNSGPGTISSGKGDYGGKQNHYRLNGQILKKI